MSVTTIDRTLAASLLPARSPRGNKGTFGRVLLVCGSRTMVGCCVLAAEGALRSGAGLVTIAFPDVLTGALTSRLTETLFLPLPTGADGGFSEAALPALLKASDAADVTAAGCGIGRGAGAQAVTGALLAHGKKPLLLDADALNCLSERMFLLDETARPVLLTPHPGEMARLCGTTAAQIEADRVAAATDFCNRHNATLLLKGHETIVAQNDDLRVNTTGNSGLAKGGSGDLLTGLIAGLAAQTGDWFSAASLGAYLHGLAADLTATQLGAYAMLPTDCASRLGQAFLTLEGNAD